MTLTVWPIDNHASDAQVIRQQVGSLVGAAGGLVAAGNLEVTQKGTPTMAVLVASGSCWVPGFSAGGVNPYFFNNSASYEQAITAANGSNPRVDRIIARIVDEAYEGSGHEPVIEALAGTPETGATLANRKGAAAAPAAAITLAFVLVPAKATSIVTADIENTAAVATLAALPAPSTLMGSGTGHKYVVKSVTKAAGEAGVEFSATRPAYAIVALGTSGSIAVGGEIITVSSGTGVPWSFIVPAGQTVVTNQAAEIASLLL